MSELFDYYRPSLKVRGIERRFPARRIFCVGWNYADHIKEMNRPDVPQPPVFMKPADALLPDGGEIPFPPRTKDLQHEVELVVALQGGGLNIAADEALGHVYGYGVGIDLTRRDLQSEARKAGDPWEISKSFDYSAPVSTLRRASSIGHPAKGRIWLAVNGVIRQEADLSDMIRKPMELIAQISAYFELKPGDLVFTGTPAGVGQIKPGDHVTAGIDRVGDVHIRMGRLRA
ncbi:MAG: fumarylacetoacetate hydrolase family protein [Gammaproteobacteria bacterium]|nr:fumarylacetoacetate hydrolase family protein [Gammaproteobacteria bacterium]